DLNGERNPLDPQPDGRFEDRLRTLGRPEANRVFPSLQSHRPEEADDPEEVVGVEMAEEDVREVEAGAITHHLPLGALATIEHQQLSLALDDDRADIPRHRWTGGRRPEEGHPH